MSILHSKCQMLPTQKKKIEKKEIHKRTWKSIMKEKSQAANQN